MSEGERVQTVASRQKKDDAAATAPEVVVFDNPAKRNKRKKPEDDDQPPNAKKTKGEEEALDSELSMKQARFDVFRFGVSGMGKQKQEDAELAQLVRLGAKAPKNKALPYPEYKQKMRQEKEETRLRLESERLSGVRMGSSGGARRPNANTNKGKKSDEGSKPTKKKKGGKNSGGGSSLQAKLGKFDGGMLKLSAKDLAAIKGGW